MTELLVEPNDKEDTKNLEAFRIEVEAREMARVALMDDDQRWAEFRKRISRGDFEGASEL